MALKKELFIGSSKLVEFDGKTSIPSAVFYGEDGISTGYAAISASRNPAQINDNFKLELGRVAPGRLEPPRFGAADGKSRSANEISRDFIGSIMKRTEEWVSLNGYKKADRILVAEPLAMDKATLGSEDWLPNYRQRIKAILQPWFKEVDFLPEPFAVFQYYRYGVKHPLVATPIKHIALVLDFGGGTFDVSVVETTGTGDVRAGGRNSKPLSAASIPVGGYFINREIAKELINENLPKGADKTIIQRAWKAFDEYGSEKSRDAFSLREDFQNFIRNIKQLLAEIEEAKINICNLINDWDLGAEFPSSPGAQVQVPSAPLSVGGQLTKVRLDTYQLRKIFVERVWQNKIKDTIINAISRADHELGGQPITVVLLSGGSSNIRWLDELIKTQLHHLMPQAQLLDLQENFQEVVSKGLAIECARRTYNNGSGDFQLVTYNRLCLVLAADANHPKGFTYKVMEPEFESGRLDEGVLLPSASMLGNHIDCPMKWRVKMPSPPKQQLDYYFLKSSLDFEDIASVHNIEHRVFTPPSTSFDSSILIELTVKGDGTAVPRFIYRQGWDSISPIAVTGKPFYLDMTVGAAASIGEAYLGFDFGSSNSSMSYVEQSAIRLFTQRSGEKNWLDLNDLVSVLPYPVSHPLAKFLAANTPDELSRNFGGALEAMLMFVGYVAFSEHCVEKSTKETKILKSFTKASAGPLWDLCKKCIDAVGRHGAISKSYLRLLEVPNSALIDDAITFINDVKHHRIPAEIDYHRILNLVGNVIMHSLKNRAFGTFEGMLRKPFSSQYSGIFRIAVGSHGPFVDSYDYLGEESFSNLEVFVIDIESGRAISLAPLMYWVPRSNSGDANLAVLDSIDSKAAHYRIVTGGKGVDIGSEDSLNALFQMCREMARADVIGRRYSNLVWKSRNQRDD